MPSPLSYDKILFLDVETVPFAQHFEDLPEELQMLWIEKWNSLCMRAPERFLGTHQQGFEKEAGIFAEYGKIVCISVGFCYRNTQDGQYHIRTRSFVGDNEKEILSDFFDLIARFTNSPNHSLAGHNIKEFDIPFICRRALINGLHLPDALQISGKKPWELNFIDTLELWKFGDFKHYTSLKTLTALFGIPTPKDDIDGSEVARVYYVEHDLGRISTYCQKDVIATIQVYLRMCGEPIIPNNCIETTL